MAMETGFTRIYKYPHNIPKQVIYQMDLKYKIEFFPGTGIVHKSYWVYEKNTNGNITEVIHSDSGSALVSYFNDGSIKTEEWYVDGARHRMNGPALVEYDIEGNKIKVLFFLKNVMKPCLKKWLIDHCLYEVEVNDWSSENKISFNMSF